MSMKVFFTTTLALLFSLFLSKSLSAAFPDPVQCEIQLFGNYHITPQKGSNAIVISTQNKKELEVQFMVDCCDEKSLEIGIEDPRGQFEEAKNVKKNIFGFTAKLKGDVNTYNLTAKCKKEVVAQQTLTIKVVDEALGRQDIAVIFAVGKHSKKASKQGWVDLKYSLEDAYALKAELEESFGFKAEVFEDPTWEDMNKQMEKLIQRDWGATDQLMIFYTGHGHKGPDGAGYLVPSNVDESIKTYYKMEDLRDQVDEIACNNIVVGIDACFASSFLERGGKDMGRGRSRNGVPFKYFIGSSPSNQEVPEKGITIKDPKADTEGFKAGGKKYDVSGFMYAFLEAMEMGLKEYKGKPIPVWYVGRKVEEMYRPKKPGKGQDIYARATRYGSQNDDGFHFVAKN